jgi:hypothetical protein
MLELAVLLLSVHALDLVQTQCRRTATMAMQAGDGRKNMSCCVLQRDCHCTHTELAKSAPSLLCVQVAGEAPRRGKAAASPSTAAAGGQSRGWDDTPYTPPPPRLLKRKGVGHMSWVAPGGWHLSGGGAGQVTAGVACLLQSVSQQRC